MSMSSCRSSLLPGAALSAMRLRRMSMVRIVAGEESFLLLLLLLQKSAKASWISLSSSAEMSFSLASLDRRLEVEAEAEAEAEAAAGALRLGGCVFAVRISDDYFMYEVCDRYVADLP